MRHRKADGVEVEVPTFRVDLEREADLIEEVCRIHGVEKIPAKMQPATAAVSEFDAQVGCIIEDATEVDRAGISRSNEPNAGEGNGGRPDLKVGLPQNYDCRIHSAMINRVAVGTGAGIAGEFEDQRVAASIRCAAVRDRAGLRLRWQGIIAFGVGGDRRRESHSWETAVREAKLDYYDVKGALEELGVRRRDPSNPGRAGQETGFA